MQEKRGKLPSGYDYTLHGGGTGEVAKPGDYVYVHFQQRKGDSVLVKSRDMGEAQPIQIPLEKDTTSQQPNPMLELLSLMKLGDSATLNVIVDTMQMKPPGFENEKYLYFDMVVTDIKSQKEFEAEMQKKQEESMKEAQKIMAREGEATDLVKGFYANLANAKWQTTPTGLKYSIVKNGSGAKAAAGKMVKVLYYGILAANGTKFDDSFSRGQPFEFPLGQSQVIPGWDEGLALLKEGDRAFFFIPAALGYGDRPMGNPEEGGIPANSDLIFYVELEEVK